MNEVAGSREQFFKSDVQSSSSSSSSFNNNNNNSTPGRPSTAPAVDAETRRKNNNFQQESSISESKSVSNQNENSSSIPSSSSAAATAQCRVSTNSSSSSAGNDKKSEVACMQRSKKSTPFTRKYGGRVETISIQEEREFEQDQQQEKSDNIFKQQQEQNANFSKCNSSSASQKCNNIQQENKSSSSTSASPTINIQYNLDTEQYNKNWKGGLNPAASAFESKTKICLFQDINSYSKEEIAAFGGAKKFLTQSRIFHRRYNTIVAHNKQQQQQQQRQLDCNSPDQSQFVSSLCAWNCCDGCRSQHHCFCAHPDARRFDMVSSCQPPQPSLRVPDAASIPSGAAQGCALIHYYTYLLYIQVLRKFEKMYYTYIPIIHTAAKPYV